MMSRQSGAVLLVVSILLAMTAALAFMLGREGAVATHAVDAQYDSAAARYLAEAALAQARWVNQADKCSSVDVAQVAFGAGKIHAAVAKVSSKNVDIVATGTTSATAANPAAMFIIRRNAVVLHKFSKTNPPLDLPGGVDTYMDAASPATPYGSANTLALRSGTANVLLSWPTTDIENDALVLSATLTLRQTVTSSVARPISVHRVLRAWNANATWRRAGGAAWNTPGGDYSAAVATATAGTATDVSWDVTALVAGWYNGTIPNNGMLLRLTNPGQSATFHSMQADPARRPILHVTYAKPC